MNKRTFKKALYIFTTLVMALTFFLSSSGTLLASLQDYEEPPNLNLILMLEEEFEFLVPINVCEYEALREVVASLSPEAFELFALFMANDAVVLEIYQLHIDPLFQPEPHTITAFSSTDIQILGNLNQSLVALGLSPSTTTTLLAVASTILTTSLITTIVVTAALTAYAVFSFFVGEWRNISSVWSAITRAFSDAFSPRTTAATMNTGFSNAGSMFNSSFLSNVREDVEAMMGRFDPRAGRCVQAADMVIGYLQSRRLGGEQLTLRFPNSAFGWVMSLSTNITVGNNALHTGVFIRDLGLTFCPVHISGVGRTFWIGDFRTAEMTPPVVTSRPF